MNKSRVDEKNLANIYEEILTEEMSTGGGVLGNFAGHGGDLNNSDWYATGDTRIPKTLGTFSRKGKVKSKKKVKKKIVKENNFGNYKEGLGSVAGMVYDFLSSILEGKHLPNDSIFILSQRPFTKPRQILDKNILMQLAEGIVDDNVSINDQKVEDWFKTQFTNWRNRRSRP